MGTTTCSSTFLNPCSWSHCVAPGSITWSSLGGKSYLLTHIRTQGHTEHTPCLPHDLLPSPYNSKETGALGSCFSLGNRRHKLGSLVSLEAAPQNWDPRILSERLAQEIVLCASLVFLSCAGSRTTELCSLKPMWEIRPRNLQCSQTGSPEPNQQQSH
jgi:hypothetical protein